MRVNVLTAARTKMRVFWDIAPCSLVGVDRRFRVAYCLHHQRDEWMNLNVVFYQFHCPNITIKIKNSDRNFPPCSSSHLFTFSTPECIAFSSTYLYKKDERTVPGNLHSRKHLFILLSIVYVTALSPTFSSLSLAFGFKGSGMRLPLYHDALSNNSMAPEPEGSSPHSQQPATGPCPETVEFTPHPPPISPRYILIPHPIHTSVFRVVFPSGFHTKTYNLSVIL
jgi:hypothetical protein